LTIKGIDDSTKEQRYESLQAIWDNSRIIDDLNDIAVLVKQTQYTSIDEVFKLMTSYHQWIRMPCNDA
jgi:hypothetical protein